jgi:hypothetical protein
VYVPDCFQTFREDSLWLGSAGTSRTSGSPASLPSSSSAACAPSSCMYMLCLGKSSDGEASACIMMSVKWMPWLLGSALPLLPPTQTIRLCS